MENESSIEKGMARLTSRALRIPMTRKMTISTSTSPLRMLFSRSATRFLISVDLSMTLVISVPLGQLTCASSIISSTASLI